MNQKYKVTIDDIAETLRKLTSEVTVGDLIQWESEQKPRPYPNLKFALESTFYIKPPLLLSIAKKVIEKQRDKDMRKARSRHWSYDPDRLQISLSVLELIKRFESERNQ